MGQFVKAGIESPHILDTANAFLLACPLQVVVQGEDEEAFKQLV